MKSTRAITLSSALLVAACGGGGGGGLTGTDTPTSGLVITAANAEAASKAAYEAAIGSTELTDLGGSIGVTAIAPGDFAKAASAAAITGFLGNILQQVPFGPETLPCAQSGSITISGNLADPLTLTANDNFVVVSDACDDGLGEVVNGTLRFTVTGFEGDVLSGAYLVSMDAVAENLQVSSATDTISSNGDVSISLDTRTPLLATASVSGVSMTSDANAGSETLSDFLSMQTLDLSVSDGLYTLDAYGKLDTTRLPGAVDYSTPILFEGVGEAYPYTGQLLVNGENSSARLTADDDANVTIEIDSDGNGTVDETINTTWIELTDG